MESTAGIPQGFRPYKRTPTFNERTIPAALRHGHRVKAGVWARIWVVEGRLIYRITNPPSETVLKPDTPGIVAPQQEHEVEPLGPVRFFVEFYGAPYAPAREEGLPHE